MVVQLIIFTQKMRLMIGRFSRKNLTDNFLNPFVLCIEMGLQNSKISIVDEICMNLLKFEDQYANAF